MIERFSPEYIDFVTNSEAIQAYKRKLGWHVGDWFVYWIEGSKDKPVLLPLLYGFEHWIARWLPTLSDLLEMLKEKIKGLEILYEQAAGLQINYDAQDDTWIFWIHDELYGQELLGSDYEKDKELAAARLFGRVVGKEETEDERS